MKWSTPKMVRIEPAIFRNIWQLLAGPPTPTSKNLLCFKACWLPQLFLPLGEHTWQSQRKVKRFWRLFSPGAKRNSIIGQFPKTMTGDDYHVRCAMMHDMETRHHKWTQQVVNLNHEKLYNTCCPCQPIELHRFMCSWIQEEFHRSHCFISSELSCTYDVRSMWYTHM